MGRREAATKLSKREAEILHLCELGLTDKEICLKLGIGSGTANTYWSRIRRKLGNWTRAELIAAFVSQRSEEDLRKKDEENERLSEEIGRRVEAETKLRDAQLQLQAMLDGSNIVVYLKDLDGRYIVVNAEFERTLKLPRESIVGKRFDELFPSGQDRMVGERWYEVLESGRRMEWREVLNLADGPHAFRTMEFPLFDSEGRTYAVCGYSQDVTALERAQQDLVASEQRYRVLTENGCDVVSVLDPGGTILYVSPSCERILGYTPESLIGRNAFEVIHRHDHEVMRARMLELLASPSNRVASECRLRKKFGGYVWVEGIGSNLLDVPTVGGIAVNFRNITDRKRVEALLQTMSLVDELTGVYNRRGFQSMAEHNIAIARRMGTTFAVMFADVDGLKAINDEFGHAAGDSHLQRMAEVLRRSLRESDVLARIGGDEFAAILLRPDKGLQQSLEQRIQHEVDRANKESAGPILSISWGIAYFDLARGGTVDELLREADQAMYQSKRARTTESAVVVEATSNPSPSTPTKRRRKG